MATTVHSITAECTSGDGSVLEITTEGQDSDAVLKVRIVDSEGERSSVYVGPDQLSELLQFASREQEQWDFEFGDPDDEAEGS